MLQQLAERLRLARAGYAGLDLALYLLAFFCWGRSSSLSTFGAESAGWGPQLAALAGRSRWPSASSVSRGLAVADRCDIDAFGELLLGSGCGGHALAHPLALATDSHGRSLAVFDFDPTVEALRLRAYEAPDLPPPRGVAQLCAGLFGPQARRNAVLDRRWPVLARPVGAGWRRAATATWPRP
jgi:hypothetical protein